MSFKNKYMSFSRLATFRQCPAKFYYRYVRGEDDPAGAPAELGKVVHSAIEKLVQDYRRNGEKVWTQVTAEHHFERALVQANGLEMHDVRDGLRMIRNYVDQGTPARPEEIHGVEERFSTEIAGEKLIGFIDRVDLLDGGQRLVITDLKTNRKLYSRDEVENSLQLYLYALVMSLRFPDIPAENIELVYDMLYFGVKQRTTCDPVMLAAAVKMIGYYSEAIRTSEFPAKVSPLCSWCSFRKSCPAYQNSLERFDDNDGKPDERFPLGMHTIAEQLQAITPLASLVVARKKDLTEKLKQAISGLNETNIQIDGTIYYFSQTRKVSYANDEEMLDVLAAETGLSPGMVLKQICQITGTQLKTFLEKKGKTSREIKAIERKLLPYRKEQVTPTFRTKEVWSANTIEDVHE